MSARKRDYIKHQQELAHHQAQNMQQQAAMQQQQYQQYMETTGLIGTKLGRNVNWRVL
jgi:hypothetical protein